jgi:hypothetical protein
MTAMMELRKTIESWINHVDSEDLLLLAVIIQIDKFGKKEKEQIMKAHINGQSEFDMLEYRDINKILSEKYYNQNYGI